MGCLHFCTTTFFQRALFADCILSSIALSCVLPCLFMAHPKILNSASKEHLCRPDLVSIERSHLSSGSQVLLHQRLAGLGTMSHFPASSIRSRSVCSTFLLEWDLHDPEVVGPHEAAYLVCLFSFDVQEKAHLFLLNFPPHLPGAA